MSQRVNNSSGSATTFSVNSKNELTAGPTSPYTYDSNGNLTGYNTYFYYTYDAENRMTSWEYSGTAKTEFVYDGLGRLRVRKEFTSYPWYPAGETRYIYDGMRVIQERDDSNLSTVSYTRGTDLSGTLEGAGGIGGLLARSHGYSGGNWSMHNFYHADGNGNITYLVNSSQTVAASYRYDPYGNTISSSGSLASDNTYRFSSKMIFATSGIYYYGYRWYDPNLQRWLNRDPIGERGFIMASVQENDWLLTEDWPNLYILVLNNPVGFTDPLGLEVYKNCKEDTTQGGDRKTRSEPTGRVKPLPGAEAVEQRVTQRKCNFRCYHKDTDNCPKIPCKNKSCKKDHGVSIQVTVNATGSGVAATCSEIADEVQNGSITGRSVARNYKPPRILW